MRLASPVSAEIAVRIPSATLGLDDDNGAEFDIFANPLGVGQAQADEAVDRARPSAWLFHGANLRNGERRITCAE